MMSSLDDTKTLRVRKSSQRTAKDLCQVVCFSLENFGFGLEVNCVEEIIRPPEIGLGEGQISGGRQDILWRERKLTILDLRKRLGYPERELDSETRIMVVTIDGRYYGAVVDSVSGLIRLDPAQMVSDTKTQAGIGTEFIKSLYWDDDRPVVILDGARVFDI